MTYEYYDYETSSALSNASKASGIVSISLNDSWTGRKILETIGHSYQKLSSPDEYQVCLVNNKSNKLFKQYLHTVYTIHIAQWYTKKNSPMTV